MEVANRNQASKRRSRHGRRYHQLMLHVDDLIEPGANIVLASRLQRFRSRRSFLRWDDKGTSCDLPESQKIKLQAFGPWNLVSLQFQSQRCFKPTLAQ